MGSNKRTIPEGKAQVNFNTEAELLFKLKYIALIETRSASEVYNEAFINYVDTYEKKNGKIKVKPKN